MQIFSEGNCPIEVENCLIVQDKCGNMFDIQWYACDVYEWESITTENN